MFWRKAHPAEADLTALADGELAGRARPRLDVEAHVAGCAACRSALDELRELKAALVGLPRASAPRSFALRQADVEATPAVRAQPRGAPVLLGGLATVALVTFVTLVAVDVSGPSTGSSDSAGTAAGQSEDLQLDDAGEQPEPASAGGVESDTGNDAPNAPTTEPRAVDESGEDDGSSDIPLRAAEAGTATLAVVAGGALFYGWRRKTGSSA